MAQGKKCPQCNSLMYALREDTQPKGTWVYYQCYNSNCKFEEKVFEKR